MKIPHKCEKFSKTHPLFKIASSYIKFGYNYTRVSNQCITGILEVDEDTSISKSKRRRNKIERSTANQVQNGNFKDWEREYIKELQEGPLTENQNTTQPLSELQSSEEITREIVKLNDRKREINRIIEKLKEEENNIVEKSELLTLKLLNILANNATEEGNTPSTETEANENNPIETTQSEQSEPEISITEECKPYLNNRVPKIELTEIECLKGYEWLNGATIELALYHLTKRLVDYQYFSTFLYPAIKQDREKFITKKINVFSKGHCIIPVYTPHHWSIALYNKYRNTLYYYDPKDYKHLPDDVEKVLKKFIENQALQKEHTLKDEVKFINISKDYPTQSKGDIFNCGVYCLQIAKAIIKEERAFCDNIGKIRREWRKTLKTEYFCDNGNDTDSEEEDMDIIELNDDDFL